MDTEKTEEGMDRRQFLQRSALAAGGIALLATGAITLEPGEAMAKTYEYQKISKNGLPVNSDGSAKSRFLVVGDSRTIQMWRYHNVDKLNSGSDATLRRGAYTSVWGGGYGSSAGFRIDTDKNIEKMKKNIKAKLKAHGKCTVFVFGTVNQGSTASKADACAALAKKLSNVTYNGKKPKVYVVGTIWGGSVSKSKIEKYNARLKSKRASNIGWINTINCASDWRPDKIHFEKKTLTNIMKKIYDNVE